MFIRLLNPIVFVLLLIALGWGMHAMSLDEDTPSWLVPSYLSLLVLGLTVNIALIIARWLTKRNSMTQWAWFMAYFIVGCLILSPSFTIVETVARVVDIDEIEFHQPEYQDAGKQAEARAFLQHVIAGKLDLVKEQCPSTFPINSEPAVIAAHLAIVYRRPQVLDYLLTQGLSANSRYDGEPLLITAINASRLRDATRLLEAGAEVNSSDALGNTPLITAALVQNKQLIETLLQAGANPEQSNNDGYIPADYTRQQDLLRLLSPTE